MFDSIREMSDIMMENLYESSFSVMATLYITPLEVPAEGKLGEQTTLNSTFPELVKFTYPYNLNSFYRIKVFPIEESGLRIQEYQYTTSTRLEPYDTWIFIPEENVKVTSNTTLFDFAKTISVKGLSYQIKGLIRETFGNKPTLHIFLTKE